jgi:hypothetical protein
MVEVGTHTELIVREGIYARLCRSQALMMDPEEVVAEGNTARVVIAQGTGSRAAGSDYFEHTGKEERAATTKGTSDKTGDAHLDAPDWPGGSERGRDLPTSLSPSADVVDCTVFAPRTARPGRWVSVQVFLHKPVERDKAERLAALIDEKSLMAGISTLEVELERGQRVRIALEAPNATIEDADQTIVWRGHTQGRAFRLLLPESADGREIHGKARFFVEDAPVGWVGFAIACAADLTGDEIVEMGARARRYRYAFISYAIEDSREVEKRVQSLRALRIAFFKDTFSLRPGDMWEKVLCEEIDRCDVFMLFWSRAAGRSEWVSKEIDRALRRRGASADELPDIAPIALEPFSLAPPPEVLAKFHFEDARLPPEHKAHE